MKSTFNTQAKIGSIAVSVILAAAIFGVGFYFGGEARDPADNVAGVINKANGAPETVDFTPFWRAWSILEDRYVSGTSTEEVSDQEKVWGAIQGLTNAYGDPYTVFLPPRETEMFQESISGSFGGVGMEIGIRDGILTVISPLKGTPAERAGLLPGDQILKVDDTLTQGMSVDEAVERIRGEVGTSVSLTIAREGREDTFSVKITRDTIQIPTIETEMREDGIFVIKLYNFSAISPGKFRESLRAFIRSGSNKLILDLRGNPGGYLEAAVDMASWFLPSGKTVVIEDYGGVQESRVHRSRGYNAFNDNLEMVILVNGGSASASEILAGALSEHGIATLVGEETFGKGSVQELIDVTGDTQLKVTVARWLTPNGNSISHGGITPDIVVEREPSDIEAGEDPQLEKAVEILLE